MRFDVAEPNEIPERFGHGLLAHPKPLGQYALLRPTPTLSVGVRAQRDKHAQRRGSQVSVVNGNGLENRQTSGVAHRCHRGPQRSYSLHRSTTPPAMLEAGLHRPEARYFWCTAPSSVSGALTLHVIEVVRGSDPSTPGTLEPLNFQRRGGRLVISPARLKPPPPLKRASDLTAQHHNTSVAGISESLCLLPRFVTLSDLLPLDFKPEAADGLPCFVHVTAHERMDPEVRQVPESVEVVPLRLVVPRQIAGVEEDSPACLKTAAKPIPLVNSFDWFQSCHPITVLSWWARVRRAALRVSRGGGRGARCRTSS